MPASVPAEKEGIDLPATCRGGICGACVARVATGQVDMSDIPDLSFTLNEVRHRPVQYYADTEPLYKPMFVTSSQQYVAHQHA